MLSARRIAEGGTTDGWVRSIGQCILPISRGRQWNRISVPPSPPVKPSSVLITAPRVGIGSRGSSNRRLPAPPTTFTLPTITPPHRAQSQTSTN